jgi:hypothetical protein
MNLTKRELKMSCSDEIAKEINYLFKLFMGFYPSMKSTIGCSEDMGFVKRVWIDGLKMAWIIQEEKLDKDLFYTGIQCLPFFNSQYMPSLGQFVNMCYNGMDSFYANNEAISGFGIAVKQTPIKQ